MQLPVSSIEKGFLRMGLARERAWPDKRVLDLTACTQPSPKHWHKERMRVLVPEWQERGEAGPNATVSCKQDTGHCHLQSWARYTHYYSRNASRFGFCCKEQAPSSLFLIRKEQSWDAESPGCAWGQR